MSGANNIAVACLAVSSCARSNGVVNAGYFCFQTMHQVYDALFVKKRVYVSILFSSVGMFNYDAYDKKMRRKVVSQNPFIKYLAVDVICPLMLDSK